MKATTSGAVNNDPPQVTAFLIPNLHCPSCVSHIEGTLYDLSPKPHSISHSIVSHTVTVCHYPSLAVETITQALEEAGYDVFSAIGDPLSDNPVVLLNRENEESNDPSEQLLDRAFLRWRSRGPDLQAQERKRKRHVENCRSCQAKEKATLAGELDETAGIPKPVEGKLMSSLTTTRTNSSSFVVVDATPAKLVEATVSIEGMSCSSCVGKISETLEAIPWIKSVNVSLITNSATVRFLGNQHANEIVDAIEDIGYDASLQSVEEVQDTETLSAPKEEDLWRATYAVGGMTCSSCVGSITNALKDHPWIRSADVSLISNSATVVFEDKNHLDVILKTMEDIGFEVKLNDVAPVGGRTPSAGSRRTVSILVSDMYCEHCPPKVTDSLEEFENLVIEKPPTIKDPILRVSYIPQAPTFTVRHILSAISTADPSFEPAIYHPMSLEERSRRMKVREQWHIVFRVLLTVIAAIPTLIIGIVYMNLVSSENKARMFLMHPVVGGVSRADWALFALATPIYFFAADIFHHHAVKELRALWRPGSPTPILRRFYRFGSMNMLISLGTTIAYFSSIAELAIAASGSPTMSGSSSSYFDSVVFLTMFLLLGRLIEAYSKAKTGDAVAALGKLRPTEALLIVEGEGDSQNLTKRINVDLLDYGDAVRVLHGDSPPCDGVIVKGETKFDESSLTGESKPVTKSTGDDVYSGTVNKGDAISVRITGVGGSSMLDQIMKVVREGLTRRAPVERIADLITGYFVPVVTVIAVATWVIWLTLGLSGTLPDDWRDTQVGGWPLWSLQFAIAVFVIACPCGIGLAAPTALFVGGGLAAKHGILVKGGGEAFQEASKLDCVVFDKTGTLTQGGEPVITDHRLFAQGEKNGHLSEKVALGLVKKLEEDSSHPIARAIVRFCEDKAANNFEASLTQEIPGKGLKGHFRDAASGHRFEVFLGNEALVTDHGVSISEEIAQTLHEWKTEAKSIVLAAIRESTTESELASQPWALSAIFAISDPIRPEAPGVLSALQRRGIETWMISGDNPQTAFAVGRQLGIAEANIIAGVLPEQKAEKVKYLQRSVGKKSSGGFFGRKNDTTTATQQRATVAMVGDGINDSPALAMADVGIAIGSGSDVAISAAKFVLITSELTSVLTLIELSRFVFRRIKFNFGWALIYNLAALPIAAGVLYPVRSNGSHVRLDPAWAALAMALSSISVVCSSLFLRSGLPLVGFKAPKTV